MSTDSDYASFRAMPVSLAGSVDLRHWDAYSTELDGEPEEWEDRANREDCWREWWKARWVLDAIKSQNLVPCDYCEERVPKAELDGSYPYDGCEECYWEAFD